MNEIKQPIRILQVLIDLGIGGAENWVRHLFRYLDATQFKIDVLIHQQHEKDYAQEVLNKGGRVIFCPFTKYPWTYARNFKNYLNQYGPYDVVHSHLSSAGLHMFLAAQAGIPIRIAHFHTDILMKMKNVSSSRKIGLKILQYLTRRYATAGLAVSKPAAESFGSNWSSDPRWQIFYLGIDLAPFEKHQDTRNIRQELGILEDAFVVGHVGRFINTKNHGFTIDIIAKMMEIQPNTHLYWWEMDPCVQKSTIRWFA
jgi:glycosyltransferase involved in cell wall biosynthesis